MFPFSFYTSVSSRLSFSILYLGNCILF